MVNFKICGLISSKRISSLILGQECYLPALASRRRDMIRHKAIMAFTVLEAVEDILGNN